MTGDPSTPNPGASPNNGGGVVTMSGAPEASTQRATPPTFDDPAMQEVRSVLGNMLLVEAHRLGYSGITAHEMQTLAGDAIRSEQKRNEGLAGQKIASSDTRLTALIVSSLAAFLESKTPQELDKLRQPPASAAAPGSTPIKDGIDPMTGLLGMERRGLGGMHAANTQGTNVGGGNFGGSGGSSSGSAGSSNSGGASYSGLSDTGYNASFPGRPWTMSESGFHGLGLDKAGLSFSTAGAMAKQGFSPTQIKAAVSLTKDLGINVDKNSPAIAQLKRDVPHVERGLRETKNGWDEVGRLEEAARRAKTESEKNELRRKAEEARKRTEEADKRKRAAAEKAKPGSGKKLEQIQQEIRDSSLKHAKKADLDPKVVDAARRGDKDAQKKLKAASDVAALDPKKRKALAALNKDIAQHANVIAGVAKKQETTVAKINKLKKNDDDEFSKMLAAAPTKEAKKPAASQKEKPSVKKIAGTTPTVA